MPVYLLTKEMVFPPPQGAADGLVAVGGDLSQKRLLLAYSMGIFPWYSDGEPILWWSPNPRLVLFPEEFHVSRRLARLIAHRKFRVTFDRAFDRVIQACATVPRPGRQGTWITRAMRDAYCGLHESGYAHSVECWDGRTLAGGLYGVSLGACFFGESMFSKTSNASKIALAALVDRVREWNFLFIDCQVSSPHLSRFGAREIPRTQFLQWLQKALATPTRKRKWA